MKKRFSRRVGLLALVLLSLVVLSGAAWRAWRQEQLNQALIAAVKYRDAQEVRLLLKQGANVETPYRAHAPISFWQFLKSRLPGRSSPAPYTQTPLLIAIQGPLDDYGWPPENLPLVQALLDGHANINATDSNGVTALMAAAINDEPATIQLLLERGADTRPKDKASTMRVGDLGGHTVLIRGRSALQYAFEMSEHTETMRLLLDHGADIDVLDGYGQTLLIAAAGEGQIEKVRLLVSHGADLHIRDQWGRTALMQAQSYPEIVRILQHAGARE